MFTGIVMERGQIRRAKTRRGVLDLEVEAPETARQLTKGDSVAVDGICLTATTRSRKRFTVQVMQETIDHSTAGQLQSGDEVNIELPLRAADRLGGHLVQGHVDGIAEVIRLEEEEGSRRLWLGADTDLVRYLVPKGSVTINGVSLTVTEAGLTSFGVALIPHTLEVTTLGGLSVGAQVNIEVDMIAKYVERLAVPHRGAQ
jgi:riboflavin synthase